jgi:chromosome segregation ATPase
VSEGLDMRGRYEQALAEVEEMKRTLREHAQRVAAREKELEQLRLDVAGRQGRRRSAAPAAPPGPDRSDELARAIAEAEQRERQAVQELALAKAERERLDEREQAIRKVERELAGQRMHLQEERARLAGSAPSEPEPAGEPAPEPPPPTPLPQPDTDPDLEPAAGAELKKQR